MASITGIGGVFFRSSNQQSLLQWYRDVLGIGVEQWGGTVFSHEPSHPGYQVWSIFPDSTTYMEPSKASFMINFVVEDLEAFVDQIKSKGANVVGGPESNEHGTFAWVLDPDGNKIELWQP